MTTEDQHASTTGDPETTPMVSIVLPVRNEEKYIDEALEALLRQTYPADSTEIVLVDGDSDDNTVALIEAFIAQHPDRRIRLFHNEKRIVPSSLNIAIRESVGDIIVRMDGHAVMADDYVEKSVLAIAEHDADVVGGPIETVGTTRFGRASAFAMSSPVGVGNSKYRYGASGVEVPTVGFGSFRRSALERAGLFDESMVRNQDFELNYRIRSTGGRIFLDSRIHSSYEGRNSAKALFDQHVQYGWWRVETLRRHPKSVRPNHVIPVALVSGLLLPLPLLRVKFIRRAWMLLAGTYGSFVTVGTISQVKRGGEARDLPLVGLAIVCMQTGYGFGSLLNILTGGRWPYGPVVRFVPTLEPREAPSRDTDDT